MKLIYLPIVFGTLWSGCIALANEIDTDEVDTDEQTSMIKKTKTIQRLSEEREALTCTSKLPLNQCAPGFRENGLQALRVDFSCSPTNSSKDNANNLSEISIKTEVPTSCVPQY